jgi:hypothetical protein
MLCKSVDPGTAYRLSLLKETGLIAKTCGAVAKKCLTSNNSGALRDVFYIVWRHNPFSFT